MSRRKHDNLRDLEEENNSRMNGFSGGFAASKLVLFQSSGCRDLTVSDVVEATNNFSQSNIIGCGGFGLVYRAELPNGLKAAIKRLSGDCGQMEREFQAEVEALSRAQHKNLVSLKGYCKHGNDRLLIYSYMENGSLDYWLHERVDDEAPLKWRTRLKIAKGAAHGLAYLHSEPNIIHRDIKTSNILLDERFKAHLADFGLARLLCPYDTHVTTDLVGTLGYIPPEYGQTLSATFKGDVYSFGVVLLELITSRRPVEVVKGKNCRDLVSWVFQMKLEGRYSEIFDISIWEKSCENELLEVLGIACKCLDQDPRRRPSIEEVVLWLDGIAEAVLSVSLVVRLGHYIVVNPSSSPGGCILEVRGLRPRAACFSSRASAQKLPMISLGPMWSEIPLPKKFLIAIEQETNKFNFVAIGLLVIESSNTSRARPYEKNESIASGCYVDNDPNLVDDIRPRGSPSSRAGMTFLAETAKQGVVKAVETGLDIGEMAKKTLDNVYDVTKDTSHKIKEAVAGDREETKRVEGVPATDHFVDDLRKRADGYDLKKK
ncbi:hypothetical protein OSB04_008001 [Centaurea solstitialis]|uniref:non-specific serine/threonine protein kinase n=1 Tax=Centaurea solstitialis TaxID=347529 RepID=A0AA38TWG1_9ASTR|nr:hypothetical protein OSB04_008001 [Centaurea solstitialis]